MRARRFVKKLRAAVLIKRKWKKFRSNAYQNRFIAAMKGCENDADLGKSRTMPDAPPLFQKFSQKAKLIWAV